MESQQVVVIEPRRVSLVSNLTALWQYRNLLWYLILRFIASRYRETVLGWLWLIIRPVLPALLFTAVFGGLADVPSEGIPYFLFFLTGNCLWHFFYNALIFTTRSLRSGRKFLTKIYFPRILVPVASLAVPAAELLSYFALVVGTIVFFWFKDGKLYTPLRPELLVCVLCFLLTLVFSLGIGLWTCVLNAQARDVRYSLPYLCHLWFYVTPIAYPLSAVPEKWKGFVLLNPMTTAIEGFRWSLLGVGGIAPVYAVLAGVVSIGMLLLGLWFFSKAESRFIDNL